MRGRMTGLLAGLLLAAVGMAAEPDRLAAGPRPSADEECLMRCDEQSDKCMEKSGGDEQKAQACDDAYTECLSKCR